MARNIEVTILKDGTTLTDEIDVVNKKELKKLKTREVKDGYKKLMKHPDRFSSTQMGDPDHVPLYMKGNDDVTFFHVVKFGVNWQRDPEIDEDLSSPDSPFKDTGTGDPLLGPQIAVDTGVAGPKQFKAGPFKLHPDGGKQRFYKFSIATLDFLLLDPDIIVEP